MELSGLNKSIDVTYISSWAHLYTVNDVIQFLEDKESVDLMFGTTTTGPQRDNILYFIDNSNFNEIASTGQTRLMALILKIVLAKLMYLRLKKKPVLFIDDVLLEIDQSIRKSFFNNLPENSQAFFTFLPEEKYLKYKKRDIIMYWIENGEIKNWKEQEKY